MNASPHRGQTQRCQVPLPLGLQEAVSHLICVLGIKPRSSERAVCAINH